MESSDDLLNGRNILIVDDDIRNIFALSSYLEMLGMNIYTAENGFQAIDFLKDQNNIEIILMDMMMPEMSGYEAIEKIKKDNTIRQLPIIAVTAKAMKGDREKCLQAGASEYVSKPINMKELLQKMEHLLNQE